MSEVETRLNGQLQASTHTRAKKCNSAASEGRYKDDHCSGDLAWEQRMKQLNPNWRPTDSSLWDAYHE